MGTAVLLVGLLQFAPTRSPPLELGPAPLDPLPPPIVAPPPPIHGHWRVQRLHRGDFISGVVVGAAAHLATAAAGLGTRDYWLCVPVAGPVLGTVSPHSVGVAAVYGMGLIIVDVGLQGGFGPLFTALGLRPQWVWQSE